MRMPVQVTFDCGDPERMADFWSAALGYEKDWTWDEATTAWMVDGGLSEDEIGGRCAVSDPEQKGPRLFFQRVPEEKRTKNRVHLDLHVGKERIDEEVARLVELGARKLDDVTRQFGPLPEERWVVMADPEGNEFCLD